MDAKITTNSVHSIMNSPKEIDPNIKFEISKSKHKFNPSVHKYKCSCCGAGFESRRNFFTTNSPLFQSNGGCLPFCKDCAEKYMGLLVLFYKNNIPHALEHFCRQVDWAYENNPVKFILDKHVTSGIVGNYVAKKNLNVGGRKTFIESFIYKYQTCGVDRIESKEYSEDLEIPLSSIDKWGTGFEEKDYKNLDEHYKMLKRNNPNADNNQEIFINSLCMINMLMIRAATRGDSKEYASLVEQYSKTFKQAGLRVIEEKDSSNEETVGVTLATISKYTPEEFYKDKKLYDDWDEIGDYFERHVKRPMQNLMTGTDIRDEEYFVPDGDNDE